MVSNRRSLERPVFRNRSSLFKHPCFLHGTSAMRMHVGNVIQYLVKTCTICMLSRAVKGRNGQNIDGHSADVHKLNSILIVRRLYRFCNRFHWTQLPPSYPHFSFSPSQIVWELIDCQFYHGSWPTYFQYITITLGTLKNIAYTKINWFGLLGDERNSGQQK